MEFLQASLARSERRNRMTAVLFLDLDHFKQINDTLGHDVGDDLLTSVAKRLQECVREGDLIARLGGDEFAVVLDDVARVEDVTLVARQVVDAISRPHQLAGRELHVSTSVGVATSTDCGQTPTELIKAADTAMYVTKKAGRHGYRLHPGYAGRGAAAEARTCPERGRTTGAVWSDLSADGRYGYRQGLLPTTQLSWEHNNVLLTQNDFLPMVESLRLMNEVGRWTLDNVGREVSAWCGGDDKRQDIVFSVDLAVSQCQSAEVATLVEQILDKYQLAPSQLELGISERIVSDVSGKLIAALNHLRELGVHIALDNFGSGVSALNYLRKLPGGCGQGRSALHSRDWSGCTGRRHLESINRTGPRYGHSHGRQGCRVPEQLKVLTQLGYDRAQGLLLGQPESIVRIAHDTLELPYTSDRIQPAPRSN